MSWEDRYNKTDTFAERVMSKFINCYDEDDCLRVAFDVNGQEYGLCMTRDFIHCSEESIAMDYIYKKVMNQIQRHFYQELIDGANEWNDVIVSTQATPGRPLHIMHPEDYNNYLRNGGR